MSDVKYADEKAPNPIDDAPLTDSDEEGVTFDALVAKDRGRDIQLRTMSWQKAAWLLAGDQVCLAIMAQSWSLSVLGWVPGIITMLLAGILFYFTSMTMWRFIMRYVRTFWVQQMTLTNLGIPRSWTSVTLDTMHLESSVGLTISLRSCC
jgi:hypothetical protein